MTDDLPPRDVVTRMPTSRSISLARRSKDQTSEMWCRPRVCPRKWPTCSKPIRSKVLPVSHITVHSAGEPVFGPDGDLIGVARCSE